MKKTGYVALGALIVALVLFISGTMMGGFDELETLYHKGDFNVDWPFDRLKDATEEFRDIKNLEIHGEGGNVELIEYDGTTIKVVAQNISSRVKIGNEPDTLVIKNTFRFLSIANINDVGTDLKIYVPRDYQFNHVSLEVDAGVFTVPALKAEKIEIDVDAGSFEADKLTAAYTKVEVDAGDVNISYLNSNYSVFDCDVGNIDVMMSGSESDYSYSTKCDVGDVNIGNYHSEGLSDEHQSHGGPRKIEADCDAGSITIKMEV